MASPKQKFDAAIKVIHSLPKEVEIGQDLFTLKNATLQEGPFQPSHEMMLTFYGFFKQATEGPCRLSKPNFWEVVKKAKWEAWHKLGDMNQEEAMLSYVEELKKTLKMCTAKWNEMAKNDDPRIVEAMPQTQVVGDFVDTLGTFYEMVDEEPPMELNLHKNKRNGENNNPEQDLEDVEAAVLNMSQKVESALKTFSHFEDESEKLDDLIDQDDIAQDSKQPLTNGDQISYDTENGREERTGSGVQSSDSEEEFCDTSDNPVQVDEQLLKVGRQEVQMSTPLKSNLKANHVHFSDSTKDIAENGRVSPITNDIAFEKYNHMLRGFPHMSSGVSEQISDSLLVNVPDRSDGSPSTLSDISTQNDCSTMDFSANNSYVNLPVGMVTDGGEENEPPGSGGGGEQDRGQGKKPGESSRPSRTSGASGRGFSGTYSSRTALLSGGGGPGGEENPPQSHPLPQDAMNEQVTLILVRLQQDMNSVLNRLNRLETRVTDAQRQTETRRISDSVFSWWPFGNNTGRTAFFILVWPVLVHLLLTYFFRRRRRQT